MSDTASDVRSHKSEIWDYTMVEGVGEKASDATRSVTKRVRLTPEEAEWLAEVADDQGRTESDVLREGLELVSTRHRRKKYVHLLIREAELVPGPEDPNDKSWQVGGGR